MSLDFEEMRPVILGAGGRLGQALSRVFEATAPQTVSATRTEVDITDYFGMVWELERLQADLVINAAAWTDVDGCERDPQRALAINAVGAGHAAKAARSCGARFVTISSDFVFDGTKGEPYNESDTPAPLSVYGTTKLKGEEAALAQHPDALVVRTAWLFGGSGPRPDFVDRILTATETGEPLDVVADQVGSPTCVMELAADLALMVGLGATGLVHYAGSGSVSRADFARAILKLAGRDPELVRGVPADEVHRDAARPADSRLDTSTYHALTGLQPRSWREALWDVVRTRTGQTG